MMGERRIYKQCIIIFLIGIIIIVSTGYLTISHALTMPAYKRLQPASINLKGPVSVAIDSNEWIYATDSIHNKVNIYGPDGTFIKSLSGLNGPLGIAVDSTDRLFIGNKDTGNVEVYDTDLSFLFKLGSGDGEFKRPCSIAIDSSNNIYVADCKDDRIKVYNPDGSFNFSFGGSGSGSGQFHFPSSIAIDDANSEIIVTDFPLISSYRGARIQIFSMSGGYKRGYEKRSCGMMWCNVGDGLLVRPLGVAADGVGRIYVSDAYQGVVEVFESSSGAYIGAVYDTNYPFFTPLGILFENNRLYVSSSGNSRIEVYTTDVSNPDIAPLYPSHDYGVVTVGESSNVYNFKISNIGGADLVIGSINLTGADSGDFVVTSDTCSGQTLISSNNCTIGVVFSPSSGSTKNAFLNITSNDPDENPLHIPMSGTGNFRPSSAPGGPYSEVEGQPLMLDGSGSNDVDGTITLYEWDINNDGIYEYATTSATQIHTYAQQGTYTIRLRVTDNLGATAEETTTASIADTSPTADFTASPTSGQAPLTVEFTNNSIGYDQPLTYEWDFDNDGIVDSTGINPSHTYTGAGQYTVSLQVWDADGSSDTLTRVDYIVITQPMGEASGFWDKVPGQDVAIPFICDKDGTGENTLWAVASLIAQNVHYIVYDSRSNHVYDNDIDFTPNDIGADDCLSLAGRMSQDDREELTVGEHYRGYVVYYGTGNNLMAWSYMVELIKGFSSAGIVVEGEGGLNGNLCEMKSQPYTCTTASVIYPRYYIHNGNEESGTRWIILTGLNDIILSGIICNVDEECPSGVDIDLEEFSVIEVWRQIPDGLFADYPYSGFAILNVNSTTQEGNEAGFYGISHEKAQAETVEGTWDVTHRIHRNPDYLRP